MFAWKALQFLRHLHGEDGWAGVTEEKLLPCQTLEGPPPQFPHLDTESSACPPLMSLWNPSWGPLFSAPLPPLPSSCSPSRSPPPFPPHPQPLTLAGLPPHRPPDGLLRHSPGRLQLILLGERMERSSLTLGRGGGALACVTPGSPKQVGIGCAAPSKQKAVSPLSFVPSGALETSCLQQLALGK